jgi:hypothetical protein
VKLHHICEVCGVDEILEPEAAYEVGWDYPPKMGAFGVISPRTCPNCVVNQTLWWALQVDGFTPDMLSARQHAAFVRLTGEPDSIAVE